MRTEGKVDKDCSCIYATSQDPLGHQKHEWGKIPAYEIPDEYIVYHDECPKCGRVLYP